MIKICHLSSVHLYNDTRILYRECASLGAHYDVSLVITGTKDTTIGGVKIIGVKRYKSRLLRLLITVPVVFFKALKTRSRVYHFHDPELIGVGCILKLIGKKVIIDIHEDYSHTFEHKHYLPKFMGRGLQLLYQRVLIPIIAGFDARVVAWPMIGEKMKAINIDYILIRNFPNLEYFPEQVIKRSNSKQSGLKFVYTGMISKIRGIDQVLDFLERAHNSGMEVSLDLYGRFENSELEQEFYRRANIFPVKYKGWINPKELFKMLSEYDFGFIFFHPIPNHIHSQPNKLFEFWASGVVPLTSELPMLNRLVRDSGSGVSMDIFNIHDSFARVKNLMGDQKWREECIDRGKKAVLNEYNWEVESKKLLELYKKVVG